VAAIEERDRAEAAGRMRQHLLQVERLLLARQGN
jgi:DNA-binding GntR family transcriptional regulator